MSQKAVSIIATGAYNCHVALLDFYLSKIPLVDEHTRFYLYPLPYIPAGKRLWYLTDPLPHRTLQTLLKKMCQEAKFTGNFTNHSLRATGATTLFDAGVPEAIIQKRTGHKSLDGLRVYERVTPVLKNWQCPKFWGMLIGQWKKPLKMIALRTASSLTVFLENCSN